MKIKAGCTVDEKIIYTRINVGSFPEVSPGFPVVILEPKIPQGSGLSRRSDDLPDRIIVFGIIQIAEEQEVGVGRGSQDIVDMLAELPGFSGA